MVFIRDLNTVWGPLELKVASFIALDASGGTRSCIKLRRPTWPYTLLDPCHPFISPRFHSSVPFDTFTFATTAVRIFVLFVQTRKHIVYLNHLPLALASGCVSGGDVILRRGTHRSPECLGKTDRR